MEDKQTNTSILRGLRKLLHPDVRGSIRSHLLGENHTPRHKFLYGTMVMVLGVSLVKVVAPAMESVFFHIGVDVIGYGLHGVGAIPIMKSIEGGSHGS